MPFMAKKFSEYIEGMQCTLFTLRSFPHTIINHIQPQTFMEGKSLHIATPTIFVMG